MANWGIFYEISSPVITFAWAVGQMGILGFFKDISNVSREASGEDLIERAKSNRISADGKGKSQNFYAESVRIQMRYRV